MYSTYYYRSCLLSQAIQTFARTSRIIPAAAADEEGSQKIEGFSSFCAKLLKLLLEELDLKKMAEGGRPSKRSHIGSTESTQDIKTILRNYAAVLRSQRTILEADLRRQDVILWEFDMVEYSREFQHFLQRVERALPDTAQESRDYFRNIMLLHIPMDATTTMTAMTRSIRFLDDITVADSSTGTSAASSSTSGTRARSTPPSSSTFSGTPRPSSPATASTGTPSRPTPSSSSAMISTPRPPTPSTSASTGTSSRAAQTPPRAPATSARPTPSPSPVATGHAARTPLRAPVLRYPPVAPILSPGSPYVTRTPETGVPMESSPRQSPEENLAAGVRLFVTTHNMRVQDAVDILMQVQRDEERQLEEERQRQERNRELAALLEESQTQHSMGEDDDGSRSPLLRPPYTQQ